mmetsp:Transcript_13052/g.36622  ORF Transcript_13052/g.36622 Transcript_13052/m.36622 type:complete len:513 (-) Transcript_13052:56-1594(-)
MLQDFCFLGGTRPLPGKTILHHAAHTWESRWEFTPFELLHETLQGTDSAHLVEHPGWKHFGHLLQVLPVIQGTHATTLSWHFQALHLTPQLPHTLVLADQNCNFLHGPARALGDPLQPAVLLEDLDVLCVQLLVSHAVHHRHEVLHPLLACLLGTFGDEVLAETWDHRHDLPHRTHLHDVRVLLIQDAHGEHAPLQLLQQLWLLILRDHVRDLVHETRPVPEAKKARHEGLGVKLLELVDMLASTDVNNGGVRRRDGRQSASSFGVAVELRHDHGADRDGLLERQGLVVRRLAHRAIDDENDAVRLHGFLDLPHFLEEGVLLLVPSTRIHDDEVVPFLPEALDSRSSYRCRVRLGVTSVKRDPRLRTVLLQLVESSRAEGIRADHRGPIPLPLVGVSVLRARRRLTVTLKTHEHDHVTSPFLQLVRLRVWIQHGAKLREHGLLDDLPLVEAGRHVLYLHRALHVVPQLLDELYVYVRLKQSRRYVLQAVVQHGLVHERVVRHAAQGARYLVP